MGNGIRRKEAVGMEALIADYIKEMKLEAGLNRQRVFEAWDTVSGAAAYTVDRFYKDGVLYCTIGSSVVRNQLYFQRNILMERMNRYLESDGGFISDMKGGRPVRNLILK
jgi:hypothetical protein